MHFVPVNIFKYIIIVKYISSISAVPTKPPLPSFLGIYNKHYKALNLNNSTSLYYSPDSIPYTAIETLYIDQSVDYGHITTIKEQAYKLYIETLQGKISGKWKSFVNAWNIFENSMIPKEENQRGCKQFYSTQDISNAQDMLYKELNQYYETCSIYLPHYQIDTDNWNKYFNNKNKKRFVNTYKKNNKDSIWTSVIYPSLIINDNIVNPYVNIEKEERKQWEYISDSKYVSKIIESIYWANNWTSNQKKNKFMKLVLNKITKMSDYMLYFINNDASLQSFNSDSTDENKNYLLSRYFSWKGSIHGKWLTKKIISNIIGIGSQNPFVAYILSNVKEFNSENPNSVNKWKKSYKRQIEFIRWLQSSEGAIVGNAKYPSNIDDINHKSSFYDLIFTSSNEEENDLFSTQCFVFESIAELYYITKDKDIEIILFKWLDWVLSVFHLTSDRSFRIPNKLSFEGHPEKWKPNTSIEDHENDNLNVIVEDYNNNIGVAASLSKILLLVGKKNNNDDYLTLGRDILEKIELINKDEYGYATEEIFYNYRLFNKKLPIQKDFKGVYGQSAKINDKSTFISIRPYYKKDKNWKIIKSYLNDGTPVPSFKYHRFWEQCEILLAQGLYSQYYTKYYPEPRCCKPYICDDAMKLGYRCCNTCKIEYIDNNIKYGYENGEWCGIPDECYEPLILCKHATRFGYPCCDTCKLEYIDDFGDWGFENDNWCGLSQNLCNPFYVEKNRKCQEVEGYECCEGCTVESEEDNIKWGYENRNWCVIPYSCKE
ncbi:Six-hairpin glycosidase [Anaeromyces robustus]|uniref:Six-hairpin glycosidase n=1 Tax=Anaeromyces robustus TaxID=1754192 RepID=A0A1Y1XKN1_9FUNG|nr:Six-hairpin glycosidase [Anaeromyces robustus]|eukprot:ORX85904.1 Six-hairpin glycosidase [Anaeromyces robustus]